MIFTVLANDNSKNNKRSIYFQLELDDTPSKIEFNTLLLKELDL